MSPFRLRTADDSSGNQKRLSFDHVALRPRQFQRTDLRSRQWSSNGPNGPSGPWMSRENMLTPGIPWDLRKVGGACNTMEHVRVPDCTCLEAITYLLQVSPRTSTWSASQLPWPWHRVRFGLVHAFNDLGQSGPRSWHHQAHWDSPLHRSQGGSPGHLVTWCWNLGDVCYFRSQIGHRCGLLWMHGK